MTASEKEPGFVERWNLVAKGAIIFMSLAYYCIYTFREYFLEYFLGLNNIVGWFGAVIAVATFFGGLLWAKYSDLTGDYKTPLMLCSALSCASFYGMYFLKFDGRFTLAVALVCFALNNFFLSAFQPLVDVLVLRTIKDKDAYGKQRLWLPISYGFITAFMQFLCNRVGCIIVFPAMSLLNSLFTLFIMFVVKNPPVSESLRRTREAQASGEAERVPGFMALLRIKRFIFVMVIVFFLGVVRGIFTVFISGYQKNVIGISPGTTIITPIAGLILEIPIFFWGKSIMNFLGVDYCLLLSLFLGLVRVVSYLVVAGFARAYPKHPGLYGFFVCTIELLKGPCFALTHSAAIKIVLAETPEILHGRAQAFYAGLYNNLSTLVSSLTGQKIMDIYGPQKGTPTDVQDTRRYYAGNILFGLAACFTVIAMVLSTVRLVMNRMRAAKNPPDSEPVPEDDVADQQAISEKDKEALLNPWEQPQNEAPAK